MEEITEQEDMQAKLQGNMYEMQKQAQASLEGAVGSGLGQTDIFSRYQPSPREYLHQFLLQAAASGCSVDGYVIAEIELMKKELSR